MARIMLEGYDAGTTTEGSAHDQEHSSCSVDNLAVGHSCNEGVMRIHQFRTDPTFDEFVWLAPMHSIGALALLVALVSGSYSLIAGELGISTLRSVATGLVLVPILGLAVTAMNMVVAYLPSILAWHLTLRLTLAHLGRRGAVRAAAASTAVTASLILATWGSVLLQPHDHWQTYIGGAVIIMALSVIASVWTADKIEAGRRC